MTGIDPDAYKRQEDLENEASIRQGEKISFQAGLHKKKGNQWLRQQNEWNLTPECT